MANVMNTYQNRKSTMNSTNVTITMRHEAHGANGVPFADPNSSVPAEANKGRSQRRASGRAKWVNAIKKAGMVVRQTFDPADLVDGVPVEGAERGTPVPVQTWGMSAGSVGVRSASRNYGPGAVILSWTLAQGRKSGASIPVEGGAKNEHHKHVVVVQEAGPTLAEYFADPGKYDGVDGPTLRVIPQR